MGFWGTLGKYALKAAPYAAMAIPGVGVPLGMAMAGGMGVANKKLQGGSWKDSLISGGIDAGMSAIPGGGAIGKGVGGAVKGAAKTTAGGVLKNMGRNVLEGAMNGGIGPSRNPVMSDGTPGSWGGKPGQGGENPWAQVLRGNGQQQQQPNLGNNQGMPPWAMNMSQSQGPQGIGPSQNPANWRYSGEDVGHEGKTSGGLSREQWRDKWMSSGTSNINDMDSWLRANGGQRMNDSGIVRTPFGEALDMGTAYKTGRGTPGWSVIPGVDAANIPVYQQQQQQPEQQPIGPQQQPNYADFQRDYWAPDREQVLAGMAPQQEQQKRGPGFSGRK